MMSKFKLTGISLLVLFVATLAACGGGGGGGSTPGPSAAVITAQPTDQSVVEGTTATFDVTTTDATGYQWQSSTDGGGTFTDVLSATTTTASYTTAATTLADNGTQYRVVVSGAGNTVTSNAALLTVSAAPAPPAFTTQPVGVTITEGQNAQFTVAVSGVPAPTLQWQLSTDGGVTWNNINGATSTTLDLAGVALGNSGRQFRAVATNGSGSIDSNAAVLTVLPRTWGTAGLIETDNTGDASAPQIAIDANGNAMVVWVQDGDATAGQRLDVWARRHSAGVWGTATLIETNNAGSADGPQLAIDANGNAIAVWSQSNGSITSIWYNRYTAGVGWGTATLIGSDSGYAYAPQIAIDANGNALVVWVQIDTTYHIWANRYTAGAGWGTAAAIETNTADSADSPQIAFDANGNAMAVWAQSSVGNIWANHYTAGGWGTAALIETGSGSAYGPRIAFDAGGNALAAWTQTNGTVYSVWSNRYSAGAWGTAALIETDDAGSANGPRIAVDSNGNALAVWSQSNGTVNNIWANRFTAGAGWGSAALIETNNGSFADNPQIAFDANGNALAVWNQYRPITYNRYTIGAGWSTAALVDPNTNNEFTSAPQIAFDANGNAWAVWSQYDGTRYNIMANRYQ